MANVGDSRAYLVRAGAGDRRQLTEDHSEVTRSSKLLPAGAPEARAGRRDPPRHWAGRRLPGGHLPLYLGTVPTGLVLCTDGLARLPEEEMARIVLGQPAQEAARQLVERAVELDGSDNCTAVVAVQGRAARPFPHARTEGSLPRKPGRPAAGAGRDRSWPGGCCFGNMDRRHCRLPRGICTLRSPVGGGREPVYPPTGTEAVTR